MKGDPARDRARVRRYRERHLEDLNRRRRAARLNNLESAREQGRAACVKYAPRIKSYKRKYYTKNKQKILEQTQAWQKANPEKKKASVAKWAAANPEAMRATVRRRRARLRGADGSHTASDILRLFDRQQGLCAACATDIQDGYHVDHMMPLSRGGSNSPENLQLLCQSCNCSKWAYTMEEWAERKASRGQDGRNAGLSDNCGRVRQANLC